MATEIVGMGGVRDRRSIPLATMLGSRIDNVIRLQRDPSSMKVAFEYARKTCPTAVPRSMRSTYDCLGMIFASRRTRIGLEKNIGPVLRFILREDEYRAVGSENALVAGDVVVYKGDSGDDSSISHVATVVLNEPLLEGGSRQIMVLSQWGADGEYFHRIDDVPPLLGKPAEFWTHRRMYP